MTENKKKAAWADCCEDWGGYMAAKKSKLEEQFDERAKDEFSDPTTLFNGIAIFVNGYTNPTADELKRLMMAHGGIYHHYLRSHSTTHLIASNLPYTKIVAYRKAQKPLPLCKPEWITDSIKAGKVLDYRNYLLYSQCTKNQPAIFGHLIKPATATSESTVNNETKSSASTKASSTISSSDYYRNLSIKEAAQTPNGSRSTPTETDLLIDHERAPSPILSQRKNNVNRNSRASTSTSNRLDNDHIKNSSDSAIPSNVITNKEKELVSRVTETAQVTQKNNFLPSTSSSMNSKNPQFLTEFFSNSRLHHIATMGAIFKDYINDLRDKSDGKFSGLESLKKKSRMKFSNPGSSRNINDSDSDDDLLNDYSNQCYPLSRSVSPVLSKKKRIIMHIDMDCFFVSVGLRNHPDLRGFPVAVAHSKGNKQGSSESDEHGSMSEVASCSYEARKAGVKNGMFLGQALKLCPNLKTIRYDFEGYKEVSYALYDTVASYTLDIEAVSCDEMYVDCTKILDASGLSPLDFATVIRNEIKQKTGCPVSAGFGENKLLARLATKKAKPDGQFHLVGDKAINFIRTLNVRDLPGVGYTTSNKLKQMNVITCAELESISLHKLKKEFKGVTGQQLHDMCRGIDNSKLNLEHVRKSISAEANYGIRFEDTQAAHEFLKKLSEEISDRLKTYEMKGRCVTLKLMIRSKDAPEEPRKFMGHGVCDVFNKSKNLIAATDDPMIIGREVINLWNQLSKKPEDARGIGIQMTKLESLKSKSAGATLLKFFDRGASSTKEQSTSRESFQNLNEKISDNSNSNPENLQKFFSPHTETLPFKEGFNFQETNQITNNLNDNLSENVETGCKNVEDDQKKNQECNISEINSSKLPAKRNENNSSQPKQSSQPDYFKKIKPSSKVNRYKMPDIQDIDMKVLIELPDDIRNEIINEYKRNQEETNDENKRNNHDREPKQNNVNNRDDERGGNSANNNVNRNAPESRGGFEENISFSQIDPEFLAALPNDVKNEIKSYCDTRKRGQNNQVEDRPANSMANKGWDMFKSAKVTNKKVNELKTKRTYTKSKPGKTKVTKTGSKKETASKVVNFNRNFEEIETINRNFEGDVQSQSNQDPMNQTVYFEPSDENPEHSEMLTSLVNCLLELPISQVKVQIRHWIFNNSDINDVDFLSLTTYLGILPKKGRLWDLFVLTKCLHRIIMRSESCVWHETYRKMIKHIQSKMQEVYEYNIYVYEIECDKCNNCTSATPPEDNP